VLDVHIAGEKLSREVSKVPTLSQGIARLLEQNLSVFNQLPQSGIEREGVLPSR
jgi:hypothetical protein